MVLQAMYDKDVLGYVSWAQSHTATASRSLGSFPILPKQRGTSSVNPLRFIQYASTYRLSIYAFRYTYIRIHTEIYIYIDIYICNHIHKHVSLHMHIHLHMHMHIQYAYIYI